MTEGTIEKGIILVSKGWFGGQTETVKKLVDELYGYDSFMLVYLRYIRELYNKYAEIPPLYQMREIEDKFFSMFNKKDWVECSIEYYISKLSILRVKDDKGQVLIDLELTREEQRILESFTGYPMKMDRGAVK